MANITKPAIRFTKLALLMFYCLLFGANPHTRRGSVTDIDFVVMAYATLEFCPIFPSNEAAYDVEKAMAVIGIVSDFYILAVLFIAILNLTF